MNGQTLLLSASQINLWRECKRKYGFSYIAGIRTPSTPAQALGTEVDDEQLQPYLRDGRPFDYTRESGYIAAAGLAYLPKPKSPGLEVQKHFILPAPKSTEYAFQGYKDVWLPYRGLPGLDGDPTIPIVVDFKTTSSLQWAKTEEQLRNDVQAQLYATNALFVTRETNKSRQVDLAWIYFQTRGAKRAIQTAVRVGADHVLGQFLSIDATAQEIVATRKDAGRLNEESGVQYALTLEPNPKACEMYGGCPFRHRCNLSPALAAEAMTKGDVMDAKELLAQLKAKKAALVGADPAIVPPGEEAVPAALLEPYKPKTAAGAAILGINPPEKDLPLPPEPVATPEIVAEKTKRTRRTKAEMEAARAAEAVASAPTATPVETPSSAILDKPDEAGESITVVWGEELYQPVQYNSFRVGPFTATGRIQPGETRGAAIRRVAAELYAFGVEERANKIAAFKKTFEKLGGGQ